ncbi:dhd [Drosophila busckii]|uniref:Thioredoxin n=1 Tax=Drosophila busckii TaxID=30019 RepID=A0A0M4ELK0_DROBS|nr:thioredoxin-1 [Drosophila busckii]ALC48358.1 dhd [Drosophila busckii]
MSTVRSMNDFHKRMEEAENKIVLLDFYATWCGPCADMDKTVKSLARKYAGKVVVLKINVDKFEDLVDKYKVRCMPTFVFLKGNRRISSVTGADDEKLTHMMAKVVK